MKTINLRVRGNMGIEILGERRDSIVCRRSPPVNQEEMPAEFYRDVVTMGHEAWKELSKETYTLGFIAAEGQAGTFTRAPTKLAPPMPGSLEDLLAAA